MKCAMRAERALAATQLEEKRLHIPFGDVWVHKEHCTNARKSSSMTGDPTNTRTMKVKLISEVLSRDRSDHDGRTSFDVWKAHDNHNRVV